MERLASIANEMSEEKVRHGLEASGNSISSKFSPTGATPRLRTLGVLGDF